MTPFVLTKSPADIGLMCFKFSQIRFYLFILKFNCLTIRPFVLKDGYLKKVVRMYGWSLTKKDNIKTTISLSLCLFPRIGQGKSMHNRQASSNISKIGRYSAPQTYRDEMRVYYKRHYEQAGY